MAQLIPLALGALGSSIGAQFGLSALGFAVGSAIGQQLIAPDPTVQGPRLDDLNNFDSTYGKPIPKVWGTMQVQGNVIWATDPILREETWTTREGGGTFSRGTKVRHYAYYATFAVQLCEGEIHGIRRIWFESDLIYDMTNGGSNETIAASTALPDKMTVYLGTESQTADPTMESYEGAGNVPGYRGTAYIVFNGINVDDYGTIPKVTVEVVKSGSTLSPVAVYDTPAIGDIVHYEDGIWYTQSITETRSGSDQILTVTATGYSMDASKVSEQTWIYTFTGSRGFPYLVTGNITGGLGWVWAGSYYSYTRISVFSPEGYDVTIVQAGYDRFWYPTRIDGIVYGYRTGSSGGGFSVIDPDTGDHYFITNTGEGRTGVNQYYSTLYHADAGSNTVYKVENGYLTDSWTLSKNIAGKYFVVFNDSRICYGELHGAGKQSMYVEDLPAGGGAAVFVDSVVGVNGGSGNVIPAGGPFVMYAGKLVLVDDGLITESTYPLDDLITEICEDSGLSASEVDATDLSAITVDGYAVTRPMPAREAIKPLQQAYWFDVAEFGGKINFVARGGASVDSIPEDDLGATYGDNVEAFVATRIQDADLPKRVTIKYLDPDLDGQQNTQYAARITTQATAEQMIELPLLLDADSAAQVAEVILYDAWQTREPVKFQIPAETYYALNPSDVVDVTYGSRTYSIRLTRIDFEIPGVMKCEGTVEDASIYTPVATGHAPSTQTDALQLPGPTVGKVLDIALISDIDQQAGFYIAATGPLSGWPGCYFMMSTDGGSSYETIAIIKDRTIMGRADTVLAMGEDTVIDTDSSLTVTLVRPDDSLSGITETQLLNLSNLALVGDEIVAFQNATNTSGSTWDLDTFLRSQRGTDWAMDDHAADEDFIVLGENIQRVALADDYIGSEIFYKFVTLGQPADLATEYSFTYQGNAYKPYSVSHLEAEDAGSGNWDISWVRRTRIGGAWRDLIDVPLMEDTESYTVEVWSGGSLSTTTDVTSESATVAASSGDTVKVYQNSATVGKGYVNEVTIP